MSYTTVAEIRQNIKNLIQATTPDSEIQNIIDRKAAVIDTNVSERYLVPVINVDSPVSFSVLKDILIEMVRNHASLAYKNLTTSGKAEDLNVEGKIPSTGENFTMLTKIREGHLQLVDAVRNPRFQIAATAMIEDYAPDTPNAVRDEAVLRLAGYMWDSPTESKRNVFVNSGAKTMVAPWRVLKTANIGE